MTSTRSPVARDCTTADGKSSSSGDTGADTCGADSTGGSSARADPIGNPEATSPAMLSDATDNNARRYHRLDTRPPNAGSYPLAAPRCSTPPKPKIEVIIQPPPSPHPDIHVTTP
ncbi:hypothetical protein GCM10028787_30920 [Brachybacterium horti]